MVLHVLERAALLGYPTWLATSVSTRDDLLAETAGLAGYHVFRGSEWDVLGRMAAAAQAAAADVVVRVTGDCPLLAPDVSRRVVELYERQGGGFASNDTLVSGWPDGLDTEVFKATFLLAADRLAMSRTDREHVTPWLRRQERWPVLRNEAGDWRHVKLSVDCHEDFERVQGVMACLNGGGTEWPATRAAYDRWKGPDQ